MWSSIRNKIILFTIVPITLLYGLISGLHIYHTFILSRHDLEEILFDEARYYAESIDTQLRQIQLQGVSLNRYLRYATLPGAKYGVLPIVKEILEENPLIYGIVMNDPDRHDEPLLYQLVDNQLVTNRMIDTWQFPETYPYRSSWSHPIDIPFSTQKVIFHHQPLEQGGGIGLLVRVSDLVNLLKEDNPRKLKFVLVDRQGNFIHSDIRSTIVDRTFLDTARRLGAPALEALINGPLRDGQEAHTTDKYKHWRVWYFSSPVPVSGWALVVKIRETAALAEHIRYAIVSAVLMILSLVVISCCICKVSSTITRPLARLRQAVRRLGDGVWLMDTDSYADDETGHLARTLSTMGRRLEDREESLRQLRASNISRIAERLRGKYVYFVFDATGRMTYVSPSISEILGYTPTEFLARQAELFQAYALDADGKCVMNDVLLGRAMDRFMQLDMPHRDGTLRTMEVIGVPVIEPDKRISGMEGMAHDITNIVSDSRRFRSLLESAPDAMVIATDAGDITMANARAEELFGYDRKALLGHSLAILGTSEEGGNIAELVYRAVSNEPVAGFETTLQTRQGMSFPADITCNRLDIDDERLVSIAVRDSTERKTTEAALRQARDDAQVADHAKSVFLSNMSHELRTPLNGVLGYTQILLKKTPLTQQQRESLLAIESSGQHLLTMINDILDLSKMEANGVKVRMVPVELQKLVESVKRIVGQRAESKGLDLRVVVDSGLPDLIVTDPTKLRQILINLLGNAIKFTESGYVMLTLSLDERQVSFSVCDSGIGIAQDDQQHIFAPFLQINARSHPGGTGLGLAISRWLVNALGGELSVSSQPGCGSTFNFSLPLTASTMATPDAMTQAVIDPSGDLGVGETASALRVLVVDPSQAHREIIVTCLDHTGGIVYQAANLDAALSEIRRQSLDMVLLADTVPVSHDLEVMKTVRAMREDERVWFIAMFSETHKSFSRHIQGDGFDGYLTNPFTLEQFICLVETCITKSFDNISAFYSSHDIKLDLSLFVVLSKAAELGDIHQIMKVVGELQVHKGTRQLARLIDFLCRTFSFDRLENLCHRFTSEMETPIVL
ncbi:PAS domain S-box protein [Kistimonas asteriae]|uniref:PAS domain S-box protein n=1 Tax=Kistimonas asteriae TaxID=517724 RepID=UPI001BA7BAA6|nr:PAS domain S-box protein [Kistimonas asteriae]